MGHLEIFSTDDPVIRTHSKEAQERAKKAKEGRPAVWIEEEK